MALENSILGFDPATLSVFADGNKEQKQGTFSTNIYHPRPADSKSTDGVYRSTIRIIYSPQDVRHSILQRQSYAMTDAQGFFQVVSKLTNDDTTCPIFSAWKKCRYSKNPALNAQAIPKEKGGNGLFDKRFERYVTIQVVDDQNNPDLNGHYMFWKMPKFVYDAVTQKMNPSAESNKASIPVMDFLFGRLVYLEIKPGPDDPNAPERKTREISYSSTEISDDIQACTNPDGSSLLNADEQAVLDKYVEQMSKIWKSRNADDRKKMSDEILEDPNTAKLDSIYKTVIEKMKEFVPDLNAELGYHEWTPEVANRVKNWISIVITGKDPQSEIPVGPSIDTSAVVKKAEAEAPNVEAEEKEGEDDLPF
jgi:hypothetical protein